MSWSSQQETTAASPYPAAQTRWIALSGAERAEVLNAAVAETSPRRSLLAPADAINALTVGALNDDHAGDIPITGYLFDPADGELVVNPTSGLGSGHHRSVKPDVIAPGGRARFILPVAGNATDIEPAPQSVLGPGVRVAAAKGFEAFTMGTSPAAAMVSRSAARAEDTVVNLAGRQLRRSELAVATKAMVAHTARIPEQLLVHEQLRHAAHVYGALARHLADGCDPNEAAILFVGDIGENESRTLNFPLPDGLHVRGLKRVTATLAWLSPTNWRHRQYRRSALSRCWGWADADARAALLGWVVVPTVAAVMRLRDSR